MGALFSTERVAAEMITDALPHCPHNFLEIPVTAVDDPVSRDWQQELSPTEIAMIKSYLREHYRMLRARRLHNN